MILSATPAGTDVMPSCCTGCGRNTNGAGREYCRSPDRGYVPRPVANRMLDIMPSDKLIFNEYRKHGTCSGLGVDGYFALARQLYDKVTIPPRFVGLTDDRLMLSPGELVRRLYRGQPRPDATDASHSLRRAGAAAARGAHLLR